MELSSNDAMTDRNAIALFLRAIGAAAPAMLATGRPCIHSRSYKKMVAANFF